MLPGYLPWTSPKIVQLTPDQHVSDLCRSTFPQIFFNNYTYLLHYNYMVVAFSLIRNFSHNTSSMPLLFMVVFQHMPRHHRHSDAQKMFTKWMNYNFVSILYNHLQIIMSRDKYVSSSKWWSSNHWWLSNRSSTKVYINNSLKPAPRTTKHHLFWLYSSYMS